MAGGYHVYCPFEGETVHRMYRCPWVVRGKNPERRPYEDTIMWDTLAAFTTKEEAERFLARTEADYRKGKGGYVQFSIENWNE